MIHQKNRSRNRKQLISKIQESYQKRGFKHLLKSVIKETVKHSNYNLNLFRYKIFKSNSTFRFQGADYRYFYHRYNITWRNERAVEIPIIWKLIEEGRGKKILEVGNVLSHYYPVSHDVIDKYEDEDGVIVKDIVDYRPNKKYDLIVAISTIEHIGWDEIPRESGKIFQAIENMRNLLSRNGKIVMTLPLGYNPEIDRMLRDAKIGFTEMHCMKRISADNSWVEANWNDIRNSKFYDPFPGANGLVIGVISEMDTVSSLKETVISTTRHIIEVRHSKPKRKISELPILQH